MRIWPRSIPMAELAAALAGQVPGGAGSPLPEIGIRKR